MTSKKRSWWDNCDVPDGDEEVAAIDAFEDQWRKGDVKQSVPGAERGAHHLGRGFPLRRVGGDR